MQSVVRDFDHLEFVVLVTQELRRDDQQGDLLRRNSAGQGIVGVGDQVLEIEAVGVDLSLLIGEQPTLQQAFQVSNLLQGTDERVLAGIGGYEVDKKWGLMGLRVKDSCSTRFVVFEKFHASRVTTRLGG